MAPPFLKKAPPFREKRVVACVGGGVVYHTSTGQYIGVATFFFLFFFSVSRLKLYEKSIENGLEGQKFLVVCLFWGGCHHPNGGFDKNQNLASKSEDLKAGLNQALS